MAKTPQSVVRVGVLINGNRHWTVREIDEPGIPKTIVLNILGQDLELSRVVAKFILLLLMEDENNYIVEFAQDNLKSIKSTKKNPQMF